MAEVWRTPTVGDHKASQTGAQSQIMLEKQASMWPTIAARDWRSGEAGEETLSANARPPRSVAAHWPSPSAALINDGERPATWLARQAGLKEQGINGNGAGMPLTIAVKIFPMSLEGQAEAFDPIHPMLPDPPTSTPGDGSSHLIPNSPRRRLNPAFAEWLMGWPPGWTIPEPGALSTGPTGSGPSATGWCLWLRRQRTALSELSWDWAAEPEPKQITLI